MVRPRSYRFEWLFSRACDVVLKLVTKEIVQIVTSTRNIASQDLDSSQLRVEERSMVADITKLDDL